MHHDEANGKLDKDLKACYEARRARFRTLTPAEFRTPRPEPVARDPNPMPYLALTLSSEAVEKHFERPCRNSKNP